MELLEPRIQKPLFSHWTLISSVDHENVRHRCPFPSAPSGHFGFEGGGQERGEVERDGV